MTVTASVFSIIGIVLLTFLVGMIFGRLVTLWQEEGRKSNDEGKKSND